MAKSRYGIGSVDRCLVVLRAIAEQGALSLDQAVKLTGVAKSTAFRLLDTLLADGLVERNASGGYRAGPEFVRWGLLLLGRLDLPKTAASDMRSLWLETGETVGLAIHSGRTIVLTEILESPAPFRMVELPGTVISPHSSAVGKVVLAHVPPEVISEIVGPEPFPQVTPSSPLTLEELEPRLARVREDGYALDIGESALGVACVAAPIFKNGRIAGGISIAGPRVRMTDEQLARLGPLAADVAARISRRLSPDRLLSGIAGDDAASVSA
jgi:DNA-binding IclR family transcriptional regulator